MAWFRWYEEASSDPKFMVVSRRTGHPVAFVVAVWAMILERASASTSRGWITGFDCESTDALLGMPEGAAEAIIEALRAKGLLDGEGGDHVAKWEERQPKRERSEEPPSTGRVQKHRALQKEERNAVERQGEPCNGYETPCNAMKRHETPRVEEIRREKENTGGVGYCAHTHEASLVPENTEPDASSPEEPRRTDGPKKTDSPSKGHQQWAVFQSCFAVHPVQQGKEDAWREWMRQWKNGTLPEPYVIRDAILLHIAEDTWWKRGKAPKMAKWLYNRGWEDQPHIEPTAVARASPAVSRPLTAAQEKRELMAMNSQDVLNAREALRHDPQNPYRNGIGGDVCALPPAEAR